MPGRAPVPDPFGKFWYPGSHDFECDPQKWSLHYFSDRSVSGPMAQVAHVVSDEAVGVRLGVSAALVGTEFVVGDVDIDQGRISGVGLAPPGRGDFRAVPGVGWDLQVNGVGDVDFVEADEEAWARGRAMLAATGTTSFQPTFTTDDPDRISSALSRIPTTPGPAKILGAHLEGPFISPLRLGAHRASFRHDPDPLLLRRFLAAGRVGHLTLAPELDGALELIDIGRGHGATVACGHSDATATQAYDAFDRGATAVTHLFNAMSTGGHRTPGLALAALARTDVWITVIADGYHVADEALLVAWRAAPGRVALISDLVATTSSDPTLRFDGQVVCRSDGTLTGAARPLLAGVRRLVSLDVPLTEAVAAPVDVRRLRRLPVRQLRRSDRKIRTPCRQARRCARRLDYVAVHDLMIRSVQIRNRPRSMASP